ncbi:MAG: DUF5518 domain-containing protein [Candidatus Aenigmatarchaeota archaeon]
MELRKVVFASLIYIFWSVLIGFFVPVLSTWSSILAALAAGIYAGYKSKEGFFNGLLAGLIGGIIGGVLISFIPNFYGIPLRVSKSEILQPVLQLIEFSFPWVLNLDLIITGIIFGGIGGFIGSKEKLKFVFIFLTLFILYIFYGAIDNMVWNWGRSDWSWNMSISHVLTNRIDLFVAVVFAAFTTILAYILLG